jgi:hypothetical protein
MKLKKIIYCILSILCFQIASCQKVDENKTIEKMNLAIKDFFISKGEIDSENELGIGAWEITDKTELGNKEIGIYLIRTVYRTDGNDYLFLKNGENFEIIDFKDLKHLLDKSIKLLRDKTDEELSVYISKLMESYNGNYLWKKKNSRKVTIKKGDKK